ncbi:disease resistance protein RPV1-like isoform X2 [Pyrus communis]|uniref:disease resistance protein RPV1-like isoform X2 n=1 Tax=Pyrus communis TaxID=23211 RepID=UPI0035BFBAF4
MDAFRDSSSSSYRCSYHAFLSFRGQDTRKGFTDHLYRALELAGIHTFRDDDEIKRGENIGSELDKAIQESQVSIIVFSKDYASSRWCLNELLKIVERRNTDHRHVVLPVFYDVDPSDVRKQRGSFAEAFATHEERFSTEMDKVEQWRRALGDVASLAGMVLGDRYEGQFIQDIVEEIRNKLDHAALDVAPFSVGVDYRVQRLNMWLQDRLNDVGVAVICGMGGIGKSTIAKAAYNRNFDRFQGSSFLADIRESSEQPSGFVGLQRKLLSDIQKGKAKKVYNMDEGTIRIKQAVGYKKVLIVLDDVSNRDQLNAILGMREWLHPGSKIIITTRHEHLLNAHEVFEKFMVPELNEYESLELFSWHAFRQSHPEEGYMELSRHVVQHCGGLPLALQVLGSSLSGKSVEVWQSALQKLDVIPNDKIQKVLRISFDSLQDDHDKNLFLHIASFFTGKTIDYTSTMLDSLEFYTRIGIENLVDRCLVKIQWPNRLAMHQLVRNMAMEIIREESPDDPGKRSRVLQKDASNILRKLSGTENVKGLMLNLACKRTLVGSDKQRCHVEDYDENSSRRSGLGFFSWKPISFSSTNSASASNEIDFKPEAFRRMHNLEILMLNNVNVRGSYEEFPKSLICLSWRGFHLKSVPENFYLENLVVLDMRNSSLQHVWNGIRFLPRLKILNLSHSHGLRTTPDFSGLPNLERLILEHCINLVEVDESVGFLEKLLVLNLGGCKNLMKLPILRSVRDLDLSGCSKLVLGANTTATTDHLQSTACGMKKLNLLSPKTWYSIWSIWSWVSLRKNIESSSFSLASLPHSLTSLSLDCCNLSEIPSALTMLPSLEYLDLNDNPITSLPESMNNLVKLRTLAVEGCRNLTMLPELPHGLKQLNGRGCTSLKRITNLPNLDISPAPDPYSCDIYLMHYNILLDSNLWYCGKLVDVASLFNTLPLSSFDIKLLKDIDLFDLKPNGGVEVLRNNYCASRRSKGTFECGIFSIFVHESKIPDRFNYRSLRNTVFSIIVPSQPNIKIVGLNACILYARQSDRSPEIARGHFGHWLQLRNETKGLKWKLRMWTKVEWKVRNEDMLWLSHWIMGNNELECGEEVCLEIIRKQDGFVAKEIGVQFAYEQQNKDKEDVPSSSEDALISRDIWPCIMGEDLSGFTVRNCENESMSTVVCNVCYYLCNHEVIDLENDSRMTP